MLTLGVNIYVLGGLIVLFIIVCVLMILTVLIQRPSGGGLSGAFGSGAGSGQTAFGAKTGDALTIATIIMFVMYLAFAVGLNYATKPSAAPSAPVATGTDPTTGAPVPPATGEPTAPVTDPNAPPTTDPAAQPAGADPGATNPVSVPPPPPAEQPAPEQPATNSPTTPPAQPAGTPPPG